MSLYADRGISYPDKKHEDMYVNVNYSRVKFSQTVANRENDPPPREKYLLYGMVPHNGEHNRTNH